MQKAQLCLIFIICIKQSTESEKCFRPEQLKLHFLCPFNYNEVGGFEMVVTPLKEVLIQCDQMHVFKVNRLPDIEINKINLLQLKFCPLPENGFKEVLKWFSTESIVVIDYEYGNYGKQTLTKENFKDLEHLRFLKLSRNNFGNLEKDIFKYVPNLYALELRDNNFHELRPDLFHRSELLEWLDVSNNYIKNISSGIFLPLKNLEYLHMGTNNLTSLYDFTFEGLINLKSLDLSANQIDFISDNAFQSLANLINISIASNKLKSLSKRTFQYNSKLEFVKLNDNPGLKITDHLFSDLSFLTEIDLANCLLKILPETIFNNSPNLKVINLSKNNLKTIPKKLFQDLVYLEEVDLSSNELTSVENLFGSLEKLKKLYLQDNLIEAIHEETFTELIRLEELNLARNQINYIHLNAFFNNDRIKIINLSENYYTGEEPILENLINLQEVDLSYNVITQVERIISLDNKPLMEILDLRYNQIKNISIMALQGVSEVNIYLNYNNITIVDFEGVDFIEGAYTTIIHLGNNPLRCDCQNYDLIKYFNGEVSSELISSFNIRQDDLICASPIELKDIALGEIALDHLYCPLEDLTSEKTGCPIECFCRWKPFDKSVIINCANRNLTTIPKINFYNLKSDYEEIELHLQNNDLTAANFTGYDNVTRLFLSHNKLKNIIKLPRNLKVLKLDHNRLMTLSLQILGSLNSSSIVQLTIDNNPWVCDCGTEQLSTFIRQHMGQVDFRHVYCSNSTIRLIDLTKNDLCHDFKPIYIIILITSLLIVAVTAAFYYRYKQELKIWLFSRKLCLCWVSEDELDADKIYDAFISYSHLDEEFVVQTLVQELEKTKPPYNLCLHYRDWVPGELISDQIVRSIVLSKRTIVIFSTNFLESVWAKAELQRAHAEAMFEGRARIIVVLYGELNIDDLDSEIRNYLKFTTYVKWGDAYFWEKLKYALPHRRNNCDF